MASANLDLVRSISTAWEAGDFGSADWADPEIEYVTADGPSPGRWKGLTGMAEGTREFLSAWEDYRAEVEEYRELDDERILVLHRRSGRGKMSGVELEQIGEKGAWLFHIRDGKVTKIVYYFDRERGLTDLGLSPKADSKRS
jgi:ketosteroid isomerase-like protein